MASSKLSLKLLINTRTNKVIFGEASKDFVDFLFAILACPIGHVIELLKGEEIMVGSIGSLYKSLKDLPMDYMQPNTDKNIYLKPNVPIPLSLRDTPLQLKNYACNTDHISKLSTVNFYYTDVKGTPCSLCKRNMETELLFFKVPLGVLPSGSNGEGSTEKCYVCNVYHSSNLSTIDFYYTDVKGTLCPHCKRNMDTEAVFHMVPKREGCVKGVMTYMVMDNLEVVPMSAISGISLLNKFQVKDMGALMEKVVEVGVDEALALLKASLESKTVLTQLFGGIPVSSKGKKRRKRQKKNLELQC